MNRKAGMLFPQIKCFTRHTGCEQHVQWQQHGENQACCWYDLVKLLPLHIFFLWETWIKAIFIILVSWCQFDASMHTKREEEKVFFFFFCSFIFLLKRFLALHRSVKNRSDKFLNTWNPLLILFSFFFFFRTIYIKSEATKVWIQLIENKELNFKNSLSLQFIKINQNTIPLKNRVIK